MERANEMAAGATYMVECFWPGITAEQLLLAGSRARQATIELNADGIRIRYLGAILMPADEVAFCLFQSASADLVREANEQAAIPFERIVESVHLPASPPIVNRRRRERELVPAQRLDTATEAAHPASARNGRRSDETAR